MILTYHEAVELMSYLPIALPAAGRTIALPNLDQSELGHLHQSASDLQTLALGGNNDAELALRQTA